MVGWVGWSDIHSHCQSPRPCLLDVVCIFLLCLCLCGFLFCGGVGGVGGGVDGGGGCLGLGKLLLFLSLFFFFFFVLLWVIYFFGAYLSIILMTVLMVVVLISSSSILSGYPTNAIILSLMLCGSMPSLPAVLIHCWSLSVIVSHPSYGLMSVVSHGMMFFIMSVLSITFLL